MFWNIYPPTVSCVRWSKCNVMSPGYIVITINHTIHSTLNDERAFFFIFFSIIHSSDHSGNDNDNPVVYMPLHMEAKHAHKRKSENRLSRSRKRGRERYYFFFSPTWTWPEFHSCCAFVSF